MSLVVSWELGSGTFDGATDVSDPNLVEADVRYTPDPNLDYPNAYRAVFSGVPPTAIGVVDFNVMVASLGRDLGTANNPVDVLGRVIGHQRNRGQVLDDYILDLALMKYNLAPPLPNLPTLQRSRINTANGGTAEVIDGYIVALTALGQSAMASCGAGPPVVVHSGERLVITDTGPPPVAGLRELTISIVPLSTPNAYAMACLAREF